MNGRSKHHYIALDKNNIDHQSYDQAGRERPLMKPKSSLKGNFNDPRGILTKAQLAKETNRCLKCGGVAVVDDYMCIGCGQCTTKCQFDALNLLKHKMFME